MWGHRGLGKALAGLAGTLLVVCACAGSVPSVPPATRTSASPTATAAVSAPPSASPPPSPSPSPGPWSDATEYLLAPTVLLGDPTIRLRPK